MAALVLPLGACTEETATLNPDTTPPDVPVDFVLLLDDDSDPDQVEGKPGAYADRPR